MNWHHHYMMFLPPPGARDVRSRKELDIYANCLQKIAMQKVETGPRQIRMEPILGMGYSPPENMVQFAANQLHHPVWFAATRFRAAFAKLWSQNVRA